MLFEAVDRIHMVHQHLSAALEEHPAIVKDLNANKLYDDCSEKLHDFYQYLACKMYESDEE